MIFQEFCNIIATCERIDIDETKNYEIPPESFMVLLNGLVESMKFKMNNLNKIEVPFVERYMIDHLNQSTCDPLDQFNDGEIPEFVIIKLSRDLYKKSINDLSTSEQAIIKVLSVYLILQYLSRRNQS